MIIAIERNGQELMYLYSKRGLYQKRNETKSRDVVHGVDNGHFTVLVMADGVSSCKYGNQGADIASSIALDYIYNEYTQARSLPKAWATVVINRIRKELGDVSCQSGCSIHEYATTLMIVLADRMQGILYYCNVGDGMVLSIENDKCPIVSMPQIDNSTCPVVTTDNIEMAMDYGTVSLQGIQSIMICSDGAWKLMYQRNILNPYIREKLLEGAFYDMIDFFEDAENSDDSSIAIIDVKGEAA